MKGLEIVPYYDLPEESYHTNLDAVFYSRNWINVLSETYDFKFFTALNRNTGNYLIFSVIDNGFEKKIIGLPFSDYVKLQGNALDEDLQILRFIEKEFPGLPIIYKSTHSVDTPLQWGDIAKKAYYHRIDTGDYDKVKDLQPPTFKQKVRQAKKKGVSVRINREEVALNDFYRIYHDLRIEKFHSIPQPKKFFKNIVTHFMKPGKGFFLEAVYEEKVIASFIVLECNNVLYQKSGCSSLEHLKLRPNNLLYDYLISYASENNFESIDLGLSGVGESYAGLVKFKESMGGERYHITYIQNEAAKKNKENSAKLNKLVSSITAVVVEQKLDVDSTDKLSEILYPFFV